MPENPTEGADDENMHEAVSRTALVENGGD